jgi:hypothetical protein
MRGEGERTRAADWRVLVLVGEGMEGCRAKNLIQMPKKQWDGEWWRVRVDEMWDAEMTVVDEW